MRLAVNTSVCFLFRNSTNCVQRSVCDYGLTVVYNILCIFMYHMMLIREICWCCLFNVCMSVPCCRVERSLLQVPKSTFLKQDQKCVCRKFEPLLYIFIAECSKLSTMNTTANHTKTTTIRVNITSPISIYIDWLRM